MSRRGYSALKALEDHRPALLGRIERLNRLVRTVDDTILHLKGEKPMTKKQMFEPFTEERQAEYAKEAEKRYDPEIVRASNRKWKAYGPAEKKRILDEGSAVYADIVAAIPMKAAADPEVQVCIARWHRYLEHFWSPNKAQLIGLAEMYNDSPDFRANFDKIDPRLAPFMREAVRSDPNRSKRKSAGRRGPPHRKGPAKP